MMSSGINLVMTVIGFAVSTMFIVFVCTRLICARIQLYASRRAFPTSSRSDLSILERGIHGLEHLVITNFPTKKYSARFALVNITRKIYCVSFLFVGTPFMQPASTNGCSSTQHARFVEFHCVSFVRKSACHQCSVQLSNLIMAWSPSTQILVTVYRPTPAFHQDRLLTIGWNPVQESPFASQNRGFEAGESISILIEGSQTAKDSGNKHVESPSNT
ncbi:hypothetical protein HYC85_014024 [Camellia sinensis]|uniref:Uncharacterized protein n=1 Tax=Camellia sinensis TaxID=4442 RepID=A0A7J7H692_CAMSI|nr:hypothetical protein HYC85_014024 [Camellia sinensis]